jgi:hypothetical protein
VFTGVHSWLNCRIQVDKWCFNVQPLRLQYRANTVPLSGNVTRVTIKEYPISKTYRMDTVKGEVISN